MLNSMTGFGRSEGKIGEESYVVEVRSVNHRYLDCRFRLPSHLSSLEPKLSELARSLFERGALEIWIRPSQKGGGSNFLEVDMAAATSFVKGCDLLNQNLKLTLKPTLEAMALTGKVFVPREESIDETGLVENLSSIVKTALLQMKEMRKQEGEKTSPSLRAGVKVIEELCEKIEKLAEGHPEKVREKLLTRIQNWNLKGNIDAQRLETEVAYFADRADVSEELTRLRSHGKAFEKLLTEKNGVGRKLDFLTQEMHREVNTLGAKAALTEITACVIEAKSQIEKLREQVQNVE